MIRLLLLKRMLNLVSLIKNLQILKDFYLIKENNSVIKVHLNSSLLKYKAMKNAEKEDALSGNVSLFKQSKTVLQKGFQQVSSKKVLIDYHPHSKDALNKKKIQKTTQLMITIILIAILIPLKY